MYKEIFARAKHYEDTSTRFLMDMVKIPSFSTKEKEVAECILKEMQEIGMDDAYIDPLGNVIGRLGLGKKSDCF